MASDPVTLGSVKTFAGDTLDVVLFDDGDVLLSRRRCSADTVLVPAERDKFRELLDRAAMPGQQASEPLDAVDVLATDVTDIFERRFSIGVDHDAILVAGFPLSVAEARRVRKLLGDAIRDREEWNAAQLAEEDEA